MLRKKDDFSQFFCSSKLKGGNIASFRINRPESHWMIRVCMAYRTDTDGEEPLPDAEDYAEGNSFFFDCPQQRHHTI